MDACILPITPASELAVEIAFRNMSHSGISAMATSTDEVTAWCDLLPAFVERCRNWEHKDNCTFKRGGIPLTKDFHRSPLCSCAPGNPSVDFLGKREWRGLAPYVTRAAISPIQPVSYLEPVGYERIKALKGMYAEITQEEEAEKARRVKEEEEEKARLEKEMAGKCRVCGKTENLMRCGRCKKVEYCSGACQKTDWKEHKVGCKS
ncbi:hypothetical protein HOY80DRAFT_881952 [Tuber brumale]|nr:hypothetical protein HOY80DRAFT_881952 [Tuber brumale]